MPPPSFPDPYLSPSGLVIGFSMSPPILDGPKDDLVIPVHGTLNITCRYGCPVAENVNTPKLN